MTVGSASKSQNQSDRSVLVRAIPALRDIILPSLFWSLSCFAAVHFSLVFLRGWALSSQTWQVAIIYAAGAVMAVWPAAYLPRLLIKERSIWRFIAMSACLIGFTALLTAFIFALQFRLYFVQWHGEPFSRLWLWQQAFTGGAAVYTYLVLGLRLYVPVALLALLVTSWWLNRLPD